MSDILKPKIYNVDRYVLATILHKPEGKGPFPAVILLSGFLESMESEVIKSLAHQLAENGIVALRFDTTGFGASEGTITEDYRVSAYMNDIDTMWNYLKHQSFVNVNAIGVWGHSLGGTLAICYSADYPTAIKGTVAVSCPTKIGSSIGFKDKIDKWKTDGEIELETHQNEKITVPYSFIKDGESYSALDAAPGLKQPILVVVGSNDDRVANSETRSIFQAIPGEKEILDITGMKHRYGDQPEIVEKVNNASVDFFQKVLK